MKVLAYNIMLGGEGRLDEIVTLIRREDPDAVALAEARAAETAELARRLEMDYVSVGSSHRFPRELGLHLALLSRQPLRHVRKHKLPELAKGLLEVEVDGVKVFATHLASRHEEAEHPRKLELDAILSLLDGGPHLLAGDLNTPAGGDAVGTPPPGVQPRGEALPGARREVLGPLAAGGYVDCYRALHPDEPGYTYAADAPWIRIDYIFASPQLAPRLRACDVVQDDLAARASDHLPIWAEFD